MTGRVCARIGCGRSIDHLRADARYCGRTCQREASRQRHGGGGGIGESVQRFDWSALAVRGRTAQRRARKRYAQRGGRA